METQMWADALCHVSEKKNPKRNWDVRKLGDQEWNEAIIVAIKKEALKIAGLFKTAAKNALSQVTLHLG